MPDAKQIYLGYTGDHYMLLSGKLKDVSNAVEEY